MKAEAGQTFLEIMFSLEVTQGQVEVEYAKELLWSHPDQKDTVRGYGKMSDSNQWNAFYSGKTFKEGKHRFALLYIVPADKVNGSAIKFLGKDYPVKLKAGK